jgi:hypothetical protein
LPPLSFDFFFSIKEIERKRKEMKERIEKMFETMEV